MKTKKMRQDIRKYEYIVSLLPLSSIQWKDQGPKYLKNYLKVLPESLVREYFETIDKLRYFEDRFKKNTDHWVIQQKKAIALEKDINALIEARRKI